jgi:hypothetical protein
MDLVSMYLGAEGRANPRERITTQGVICRDDPYSIVICSLRDMSPAKMGTQASTALIVYPAAAAA